MRVCRSKKKNLRTSQSVFPTRTTAPEVPWDFIIAVKILVIGHAEHAVQGPLSEITYPFSI